MNKTLAHITHGKTISKRLINDLTLLLQLLEQAEQDYLAARQNSGNLRLFLVNELEARRQQNGDDAIALLDEIENQTIKLMEAFK